MRKHRVLAIALLCASFIYAQEQPPPSEEQSELAELMSIVEQETEVATKTRMNSDYVPGIVTVLEGDELEALGIATAADALSLVPGMQATRDSRSSALVLVRGIDFPFNSGNIQILINGIALTRQDAGVNAAALLIPVEQIERIEIIRGPGSVIHGDFAFMGLVNIILRKDGVRVFGRLETPHGSFDGGGHGAWHMGRAKLAASLSRFTSDDTRASTNGIDEDRWFGLVNLERGGLTLTAETVQRTFNTSGTGPQFDEESWALAGQYRRDLSSTLYGDARVSYLHNDIRDAAASGNGDVAKFTATATWTALPRQSWLLGADYTTSTIDHAEHRPVGPPGAPPPPATIVDDESRNIVGLVAQDTIDIGKRLALTIGARYDSYSDLDERLTPRVSVVWRASDQHILKAQYAEGFRTPTFFELYARPAPGITPRYPFEVNATTELHYVYRAPATVARATLYQAVLRDMVFPGGVVLEGNAESRGLELEWSRQLTPAWKIDTNASFVFDTEDPRVQPGREGNQIGAPVLGNIALLYRPLSSLVIGARWNHVGDPEAGEGYDVLDLTVSHSDVLLRGLGIRAGIRNGMDSEVTYLDQPPRRPVSARAFPGRTVWLQLSWRP